MTESSAKSRILFVDDESLVLQGLQRMLRPLRSEWEMDFVLSGHLALQRMAENDYNVVVTDMRMPGMNGAQFLKQVKESYPDTIRLILSGHADKGLIMDCVGTAHQFLAKPCEPEALRTAIATATAFGNSLKSEEISRLVTQMDNLPSLPSLVSELMELINEDQADVNDLGAVIARDLGMTAKLLKLVNSAFFGLKRQISDPSEAVAYLGFETIKSLVLAVNAFGSFEGMRMSSVSIQELWTHSLEVAQRAKLICEAEDCSKIEIAESFTSGMLHDVGKLVLGGNVGDKYSSAIQLAQAEGIELWEAEKQVFGADHGEIGGYLLRLWGLPASVVEAIALHHQPARSGASRVIPLIAVHVADAQIRASKPDKQSTHSRMNTELLQEIGVTERVKMWEQLTYL